MRVRDCETQGLKSSWMSLLRGISLLNHCWYAVIMEDKWQDAQVLFGWINQPLSFPHIKDVLMIRRDLE